MFSKGMICAVYFFLIKSRENTNLQKLTQNNKVTFLSSKMFNKLSNV